MLRLKHQPQNEFLHIVLSIDFDGLLTAHHKHNKSKVLSVNDIISDSTPFILWLIDFCKTKINEYCIPNNTYKQILIQLLIGTARQNYQIDTNNSNENRTCSCYKVYDQLSNMLADRIQTDPQLVKSKFPVTFEFLRFSCSDLKFKMYDYQCTVVLREALKHSPTLYRDEHRMTEYVIHKLLTSNTFTETFPVGYNLKAVSRKDNIPFHIFDETKVFMLSIHIAMLHQLYQADKNRQIILCFFDDRHDILNNLKSYFFKNPKKIPNYFRHEAYHYDNGYTQHISGLANDEVTPIFIQDGSDTIPVHLQDPLMYVKARALAMIALCPDSLLISLLNQGDNDTLRCNLRQLLEEEQTSRLQPYLTAIHP